MIGDGSDASSAGESGGGRAKRSMILAGPALWLSRGRSSFACSTATSDTSELPGSVVTVAGAATLAYVFAAEVVGSGLWGALALCCDETPLRVGVSSESPTPDGGVIERSSALIGDDIFVWPALRASGVVGATALLLGVPFPRLETVGGGVMSSSLPFFLSRNVMRPEAVTC